MTTETENAFRHLKKALKGSTQDNFQHLVNEIKALYDQALIIQNLTSEYNSGVYFE